MDADVKYNFKWKDLGDIAEGRPTLGPTTQVAVYRLLQFTLRDVLDKRYGPERTNDIFIQAGYKAGKEFCNNIVDIKLDFSGFIADLTEKFLKFGIGVLRVEKAEMDTMSFILTVSEDLDCSGLPVSGMVFCDYDEGFISGILNAYTGKNFRVKEVDCWGTGERTCRFTVDLI